MTILCSKNTNKKKIDIPNENTQRKKEERQFNEIYAKMLILYRKMRNI